VICEVSVIGNRGLTAVGFSARVVSRHGVTAGIRTEGEGTGGVSTSLSGRVQ
jgi:hypothetical protein